MTPAIKLLAPALLLTSLSGCAVYGPPPYSEVGYYESAPVYAYPAPVYAYPAPVVPYGPIYAGPPVTFGFDFLYRSGGGHRHGGHGWGRRNFR
jgi:hypothetical protein